MASHLFDSFLHHPKNSHQMEQTEQLTSFESKQVFGAVGFGFVEWDLIKDKTIVEKNEVDRVNVYFRPDNQADFEQADFMQFKLRPEKNEASVCSLCDEETVYTNQAFSTFIVPVASAIYKIT